MKINRNDPCPCGSGKKYKKCCLLKESIVQISEVKEERFLRERHELMLKLTSFIDKKIPRNQLYRLHSEFRRRTQSKIPDKNELDFFQYWLNFFHSYENGLRGIEWFLKENGTHLSNDEKTLAEKWAKLTPKVVQAIGKSETDIQFEEVNTKEQFTILDNNENVPDFAPWIGTISLIDRFDNKDYFNGISIFQGPENMNHINDFIQKLMVETKSNRDDILFHYYPEIIGEFLKDPNGIADREGKEIHVYSVQYQVQDEEIVSNFLQGEPEFVTDYWEQNAKRLSWLQNYNEFMDNEMEGKARLAESKGIISLRKNQLQFDCYDKNILEQFKQKVNKVEKAVEWMDEKEQSLIIPSQTEVKNMAIQISENVPKYFILYAQNNLQLDIDKALPKFDDLSPREMVQNGRVEEVDTWLKQLEYKLYLQVKAQFEEVEKTADFNTVRKELGLPLSSFVTGGENRVSAIVPINQQNKEPIVKNEDIPFYEDLGFTPDTIDNVYAKSFVNFFKEKTDGKSENTVRKYRNSLSDLREILEAYSFNSWDELTQKQWERILTKDYFDMFESVSKTQVKDFLSTVKALVKWLDEKENTRLSEDMLKAMEVTEKKRLQLAGI
ncbi:SEC-C domain-containing protein [Bacillus sp. APMAM]|nr:SEC-C domain-containing protein [Bacillus sp. APMAM]RTZ54271.1 SEC-C domain-containing protein [Bacillus sp. SAJ1]